MEDDDEQEGQTFFLNVQESSGAIQIGEELYSKECLTYWDSQLKYNDRKRWKGPGKCWCDRELKEQQSCEICEQR